MLSTSTYIIALIATWQLPVGPVRVVEGLGLLGKRTTTNNKVKASAEKALSIYDKNFPFDRVPAATNKFTDAYIKWGVPQRDIDGTKVFQSTAPRKRATDISRADAVASFNELAKVYGDDRALQMVKILPLCLAFDRQEFKESFQEWADIFGSEKTKDMVARNPGLLAVKRYQASTANDQTMVFSYIVAYTRPIGAAGPIGIILLAMVPFIEALTGVEIRSTFFSALSGGGGGL